MKIAIVSNVYKPFAIGGAEVSSELLARGLHEAGHDVFVVTMALDNAGPRTEIVDGLAVHRLATGLPYRITEARNQPKWAKALWHAMDLHNPAVHANVRRLFANERPQVVHTNVLAGLSTAVWSAAHNLGIPLLHTLRDYYLLCVRSNLATASGELCRRRCAVCRVFSACQRLPGRHPNAVAGISSFVLDKHREFGFFTHVPGHVIHNAVPTHASGNLLRTAKPAGSELVAVFMGRLEPSKGPQVALDAIERSPSLRVRLHLCGDGPSAEQLRRRYGGDRRVHFEGPVTGAKKQALLDAADVMLVPSIWFEPFGRTVIEGYQHGLAVVGSRIGGIPELIEDGATGRLFSAGNCAEMATILAELAADRVALAAMQQRAAAKAAAFSLPRHVAAYEAVYRSLTT